MKRLFLPVLCLIIAYVMSCEGSESSINCSDCTAAEPYEATLKCEIDMGVQTLLQIWEGKLEDSLLVYSKSGSFATNVIKETVSINRDYAVTATYIIDNKTYVAVGSASPRVIYSEDKCDDPCYFVYGNKVNLRLKYKR